MRLSPLLSTIVGLVLAAASVAHADNFTNYDLIDTFSSGGTITGTVTLDDTTGVWTAANLTTANFVASNEQFTEVEVIDNGVFFFNAADQGAYVFFATVNAPSTYVGQSTIPIEALQFRSDKDGEGADSASLVESKSLGTPSPTPEPASIALLGTGALMGFAALRRRLIA